MSLGVKQKLITYMLTAIVAISGSVLVGNSVRNQEGIVLENQILIDEMYRG